MNAKRARGDGDRSTSGGAGTMRRFLHHARALGACTRGAAAVEFAIVSGVLVMLLVGTVDLGRTLYIRSQIAFLADRAVRQVLLQPDVTAEALAEALREQFTAGNPDSLEIAVTSETADGTTYRIVTVGFPVTLFIPHLESGAIALSVSRRVPAG